MVLVVLKLILVPWRAGECRKTGAMTNEEAVVLAVKETVRYGLFLGTFAGSYVSVDEYIAAVWGRKRSVHGTITVENFSYLGTANLLDVEMIGDCFCDDSNKPCVLPLVNPM